MAYEAFQALERDDVQSNRSASLGTTWNDKARNGIKPLQDKAFHWNDDPGTGEVFTPPFLPFRSVLFLRKGTRYDLTRMF